MATGDRTRTVDVEVNSDVKRTRRIGVDTTVQGIGSVPVAVQAYVSVEEKGDNVSHQTVFTITDLPQSVINATEFQSSKIYDFPGGRILAQGTTMTIAQTTTSELSSTLNASSTGALGLGTAAASNVALTSTMVDLMPTTAFTSSAIIDVAGTAVSSALVASAHLDGTTTAKDIYLNTAYATTADVDADATQTISGTFTVSWVNLGDF